MNSDAQHRNSLYPDPTLPVTHKQDGLFGALSLSGPKERRGSRHPAAVSPGQHHIKRPSQRKYSLAWTLAARTADVTAPARRNASHPPSLRPDSDVFGQASGLLLLLMSVVTIMSPALTAGYATLGPYILGFLETIGSEVESGSVGFVPAAACGRRDFNALNWGSKHLHEPSATPA